MEEIQKTLAQTIYLLGQQVELRDELRRLSEKLPPLLQAQAEEFEKLTGKIAEAKAELGELEGKIAQAQQRHDQLAASESSLQGRINAITEKVVKAVDAFQLPQATA